MREPILRPITPMSSKAMIRTRFKSQQTYFGRYNGEFSTFIDAIENPNPHTLSLILSTFDDAAKTYELTWKIRQAAEKNAKNAIKTLASVTRS